MRTLLAMVAVVLIAMGSACSDDGDVKADATADAKPQSDIAAKDTATQDSVADQGPACNVTCPDKTTCEGSNCYPVCTPSCAQDEYCSANFTCVQWSGDGGAPRPTVPPLSADAG